MNHIRYGNLHGKGHQADAKLQVQIEQAISNRAPLEPVHSHFPSHSGRHDPDQLRPLIHVRSLLHEPLVLEGHGATILRNKLPGLPVQCARPLHESIQ